MPVCDAIETINETFDYRKVSAQYKDNAFVEAAKCDNYSFGLNYGSVYLGLMLRDTSKEEDYETRYPAYCRKRQTGWKLHISIDDSDADNIKKGWDIVRDVLMKYRVYSAKCISDIERPLVSQDESQNGKQITIYMFKEERDPAQWQAIATEIELALRANHIRADRRAEGDQAIAGSHYMSYRNDNMTPYAMSGGKGRYSANGLGHDEIGRLMLQSYRQQGYSEFNDPFEGFTIADTLQAVQQQDSTYDSESSSNEIVWESWNRQCS